MLSCAKSDWKSQEKRLCMRLVSFCFWAGQKYINLRRAIWTLTFFFFYHAPYWGQEVWRLMKLKKQLTEPFFNPQHLFVWCLDQGMGRVLSQIVGAIKTSTFTTADRVSACRTCGLFLSLENEILLYFSQCGAANIEFSWAPSVHSPSFIAAL